MLKQSMVYKTIFIIAVCLLLGGCDKAMTSNLQHIVVNLSATYPALWKLSTAVAYLFGFTFIFRGIYQLKVYGDMRTQMSSSSNIRAPLILLVIGAALMFFPTTKSVLLETTFGVAEQSPLSYSNFKSMNAETMRAILGLVQLVGVISFIRGWILLANSASPGGQSQFPKAMTHIIGGLFAINIQGTIDVMNATLFP